MYLNTQGLKQGSLFCPLLVQQRYSPCCEGVKDLRAPMMGGALYCLGSKHCTMVPLIQHPKRAESLATSEGSGYTDPHEGTCHTLGTEAGRSPSKDQKDEYNEIGEAVVFALNVRNHVQSPINPDRSQTQTSVLRETEFKSKRMWTEQDR